METSISLWELREEDLDAVSAGMHRHQHHFGMLDFLERLFGYLDLGQPNSGNLLSGGNVLLTNTGVNIAVVIGGGSVVQVINQYNVV